MQLVRQLRRLYAGEPGLVTGRLVEVSTGTEWVSILFVNGHWWRGGRPWLPLGVSPLLAAWVDDLDERSITEYLMRMGAGEPAIIESLLGEGFSGISKHGGYDSLRIGGQIVTSPPQSWVFIFDGDCWDVQASVCPGCEPIDATGEAILGSGELLKLRLYPAVSEGLQDEVVFESTGIIDVDRLRYMLMHARAPQDPEYVPYVRGAAWLVKHLGGNP